MEWPLVEQDLTYVSFLESWRTHRSNEAALESEASTADENNEQDRIFLLTTDSEGNVIDRFGIYLDDETIETACKTIGTSIASPLTPDVLTANAIRHLIEMKFDTNED